MNFLELVNRLRRKCRVSGAGPTDVDNQIEEYARLVDWINEAWMEIQLRRSDWRWMRSAMTFPTVGSQPEYTLAQIEATGTTFSAFSRWDLDSFRQYVTAVGTGSEIEIPSMDYDDWRDTYFISATRDSPGAPVTFAMTPALGIVLGPVPLEGYTISGVYFKKATELVENTDVPTLPEQYHMAIVYKAMMYFGTSEAAPEIYDEGWDSYRRMMNKVEIQQLPQIRLPEALA